MEQPGKSGRCRASEQDLGVCLGRKIALHARRTVLWI
jgi:hypothetical protein